VLEAVNISHTFDYLLFEDVNLKINPKDKIAIIGKSGSGKSTLLHILAALLKPQKGNVFYNGFDIYSLKEKDLINIGAYAKGSNPKWDIAIEKIDRINEFLKQGIMETVSMGESLSMLKEIVET